MFRRSPPDVILGKGVLKTYSKNTGEHQFQSVISLTLLCNHTLARVLSCKCGAYFQNTFFQKHLWRAACECSLYIEPCQLIRSVCQLASF